MGARKDVRVLLKTSRTLQMPGSRAQRRNLEEMCKTLLARDAMRPPAIAASSVRSVQLARQSVRSVHVAFIYSHRGHLLAVASNRHGTRSQGAGFDTFTLHAERAALKAVGDHTLLRGATLAVVRIGAHGDFQDSAPCHACATHIRAAMRKHRLRRVLFTRPAGVVPFSS